MGARRVLLPTIGLVSIGILVFATAKNFEMLLLSQVLIGLGACSGFVGAGYVGGTRGPDAGNLSQVDLWRAVNPATAGGTRSVECMVLGLGLEPG